MSIGRGKKVLVAMSGGVDSAVAAALLQEDGYEVVGCFMRLGSEDSVEAPADDAAARTPGTPGTPGNPGNPGTAGKAGHQGCCSVNDAGDARLVAALLDVPFYVLNFKKDFGRIIDYFVAEYNAGRTPNPCVRCNDWLKFGKLMAYARSIDADYVATGHYARVEHTDGRSGGRSGGGSGGGGRARLLRGIDHRKDQSYVLFGAQREALAHMLLPIGGYHKDQVRAMAHERCLPVFDKPDSQEICFVPDNDYARLVRRRTPERVQPGAILDREGKVLGEHPGQQHFTIGQRRKLGVALGHPVYVVERDPAANTVTVGSKDDLLAGGLAADQTNWLIAPPTSPRGCQAKVRYNSQPVPASVWASGTGTLEVRFEQPQEAVTPGQAVVCYDGDEVLGGGWITRAVRQE